MKIEQVLRDRIAEEPTAKASVVLCCVPGASVPEDELAKRGLKVSEVQRVADECLIYGDIVLGDIAGLGDVPGIDEVASAPEARAL